MNASRKTGRRGEGPDAIRRPRTIWPAKCWSGQGHTGCAISRERTRAQRLKHVGDICMNSRYSGSSRPLGACLRTHNKAKCYQYTALKLLCPDQQGADRVCHFRNKRNGHSLSWEALRAPRRFISSSSLARQLFRSEVRRARCLECYPLFMRGCGCVNDSVHSRPHAHSTARKVDQLERAEVAEERLPT